MSWQEWYAALAKPDWTPSGGTIGRIWQVLYPILFASIIAMGVLAARGRAPWRVMIPFAVNLVANLVFTPIQFGLRNLPLATFDILIVWGSIPWMMYAAWPHARWVTWAQVPYLAWVSTATVLQVSITWMNR